MHRQISYVSLISVVLITCCVLRSNSVAVTDSTTTVFCLHCKNISHPSLCPYDLTHLVECQDYCIVERQLDENGNFTYNLGCGNDAKCAKPTTTVSTTRLLTTTTKSSSAATTTTTTASHPTGNSTANSTSPPVAPPTTSPGDNSTINVTLPFTGAIPTHGNGTTNPVPNTQHPSHQTSIHPNNTSSANVTTSITTSITTPMPSQLVGRRRYVYPGVSDMRKEQGKSIMSESLYDSVVYGVYGEQEQGDTTDDYCQQCCEKPECNKHALKCVPGACYDEVEDCASFDKEFDICNNTKRAKTICRKQCNLCDLVDGQWADWTEWADCSLTCGNGTRSRMRNCTNPVPVNGGEDCEGSDVEDETCIKETCPADGNWSDWAEWSACDVKCGVGLQHRDRTCNNPFPDADGLFCLGEARDYSACFRNSCQDGKWLTWSAWGTCSRSCGDGLKTRSRGCSTLSLFGHACVGDAHESELCIQQDCPAPVSSFTVGGVAQDGDENGTIILSYIITNVGDDYNVSTGEFTCRIPGLYYFFVSLEKQVNVSEAYCHLLKNGDSTILVASRMSYVDADSYQQVSNAVTFKLQAGDVTKLGRCTRAETLTNHSTFSGYLVAPIY